jgi:hypothetical protein
MENIAVQAEEQISAYQTEIANKDAMIECLERKITNPTGSVEEKSHMFNAVLVSKQSRLSVFMRCFKHAFKNFYK